MKKELEIIAQLKKEIEEWRGKYLRALADYQNLEKRVAAERSKEGELAAKKIVLKILPILDVLEKAVRILNDQGLNLVVAQFKDVLEGERVEKMKVRGEKFDPKKMECLEVVGSEKEEEVVEEVRPGYMMGGEVVRVAQVKVGKKNINKKAEELAKKELRKGNYM